MENDKWARIIGIPLVSILLMAYYDYDSLQLWNSTTFKEYIGTFIFTLAMWEGNRAIFFFIHARYPDYQQTRSRVIYQVFFSVVYTFLASVILTYLLSKLFDIVVCDEATILENFLHSMIPTAIISLIYESVTFFEAYKRNIQQTEALAKEHIISQLEALKNQVDPHFLFNSLNTLAALIDEHNQPAQKYLEQLSDVYRYVLVSKEKTTVTLEEELAFLESYIYLNKTRFRDNLVVENNISSEYHRYMVAPLTLQMLIENAIKHNIISKEKPLTIRLTPDTDEYITVENNIQEKTVFEKSTKVGLQNIINRYGFLTPKKIQILKQKDFFTVKIPLISMQEARY